MMAQPALLQVNGMPGLAHRPESPIPIPSKRKRESSEDAPADASTADQQSSPTAESLDANGSPSSSAGPSSPTQHQHHPPSASARQEIENLFHTLQRLDKLAIFQRTVPGDQKASTSEPNPKRQKSEDPRSGSTIAEKVTEAGYENVDLFVKDVLAAVKEYTAEVLALPSTDKAKAVARASQFRDTVVELHRQETSYPLGGPVREPALSTLNGGTTVLTAWGHPTQPKQVFSSLQRPDEDGEIDIIDESDLPDGVSLTKVMPSVYGSVQARAPTLGELFPAARNMPPLQPPKAPKNVTRDKELGFYHPELTKRSPSRAGVYSFQPVHVGHYLDYSNATPPSQTKTKQRERAQSLAGVKPSLLELEMSEMEALFRGSFSSFAPAKDDTRAVVPSNTLGRMWWQSAGYRQMERLAEAYREESETEDPPVLPEVDMEYVESAISELGDQLIDPDLEKAIAPEKSKEEMDTEELLQEVSDLIQALDSHQRNRNLALPTTQNRHSTTDPANGDMLKHASTSQPTEDEMATYEILKSQLSLIIGMLPPHAVAKLKGLPDGDLLVSKRVEIRSDTYNGVMDEDESAIRAKQQQQQQQQQQAQQAQQAVAPTPVPASMPRGTPHRTPSVSGPVPGAYGTPGGYPASQYTQQSRPPMQTQPYYGQTPVRQAPVNMPPRPSPGMPQQMSQPQRAPPVAQPYGPRPGGYPNYGTQMFKPQNSYGPGGGTPQQYGPGTPPPQRMQPQHPGQPPQPPNYGQMPPGTSPGPRYSQPSPYPGSGYQHQPQQPAIPQQQPQPQQQPPAPPQQQQQFQGYPNGAPMGQRPMPQQMPNVQQYSVSPGQQHSQPRPTGYGPPAQQAPMHPGMQRQFQPQSNAPMNQQTAPQHLRSGYHTVMNEHQHHSIVERAQAQARQSAHEKTLGLTGAGGMPAHGGAGLAGIGLGGGMNHHRMSVARTGMPNSSSPSPRMHPGQPVPPGGQMPPANMNGMAYHGQPMYNQAPQHMQNPNPTPSPVGMQSPHPPPQGVPSPQPRPA